MSGHKPPQPSMFGSMWQAGLDALAPTTDPAAPHQAAAEAHTTQPSGMGSMLALAGDARRAWNEHGAAMLMDPVGVIDRERAERELADRFNVVKDKDKRAGKGNTVSQTEFEQLATQYSDIRLGRSHVKLDTDGVADEDAPAVRGRIMADVADIMQTPSGRSMIGQLAAGPRDAKGRAQDTYIGPTADRNEARGGDGHWDNGERFGTAYYPPGENFDPAGLNARSDVTLYHELTHAWNKLFALDDHGELGSDAVAPQDAADDRFEYQSVGLGGSADDAFSENRYRDERRALTNGTRTLGGKDADLAHRDAYNLPGQARTGDAQ
ncbi:MAG: type III secretion system effector protein [Deltaproteobacteria bacterium]|nr:type III secretion system effector protein [Deltaproteobacteria bacterium]